MSEAVRRSGPVALRSRHAAQDNWLLSAILPRMAFHAVPGTRA